MKMLLLMVIICLVLPGFAGAQEIDEHKLDCLILILFEALLGCYILWMLIRPDYFIFVLGVSVFVLIWNGVFVHWATLGYINVAILPLSFLVAMLGGVRGLK